MQFFWTLMMGLILISQDKWEPFPLVLIFFIEFFSLTVARGVLLCFYAFLLFWYVVAYFQKLLMVK